MIQRYHNNKVDYGTQYFYREYLKDANLRDKEKITQKLYALILKTFFQLVIDKIVHETYRFFFPGIGLFYLIRTKNQIKKNKNGSIYVQAATNWPATKELRIKTGDPTKRVYYLNDHTNGHIYHITWDKTQIHFVNKNFYKFVLNRKHKLTLAKIIKESDSFLNAYESWYK